MSLSDFLSGIWTGENAPADRPESTRQRSRSQSPKTVVYECRYCGTTVSVDTIQCPTCDSDEIATYPIE